MSTIEEIKAQLEHHRGEKVNITFNGSRNKVEKFEAVINEIYPFVFVVNIVGTNEKKSFSYSDVLTNTIEIYFE